MGSHILSRPRANLLCPHISPGSLQLGRGDPAEAGMPEAVWVLEGACGGGWKDLGM